MPRLLACLIVLGLCNVASAAEPAKPDAAKIEFFEKNIRPIFVAHCVQCHGPDKQKGGFRLDTKAAMMAGGDSGTAMVVGKPDESRLIHAVRYNGDIQMPPGKKLSDDHINAMAAWVKMGAPWPPEATSTRPVDPDKGFRITDKDREFWSFQPVKRVPAPAVAGAMKSPIDNFVLAKLQEAGLKAAPTADRRTLVRRATFDLIGLPPTPDEMEAALSDRSPEWFEKVIDRLLASPHYGERYARHWLDVARYAEDQAHSFQPRLYPHGYRYRDWVVKAFNSDKPYDRFIIEQIAGDLIDGKENEDQLAALGYFALGPVYYGRAVLDELDDRVDVLCRGFLGLTVACARCHDHKFDPIPTRDYYSLAGIFSSTQYKEYPVTDPKTAAAFDKGQAEIKVKNDAIAALLRAESDRLSERTSAEIARYIVVAWQLQNARKSKANTATADVAKQEKLYDFVLDRWVNYLFPKQADERPHLASWREMLSKFDAKKDLSKDADAIAAVRAVAEEFQAQILAIQATAGPWEDPKAAHALLREVLGLQAIPRQQVENLADPKVKTQITQQKAAVEKLKKDLPKIPVVHSLSEGTSANMKVHLRGNPATLGDEAPRGFLSILGSNAKPQAAFKVGSGRLELAQAIASKDNPLTARVMVNRIWAYHFGRGIVGTPSNFGHLGERPSHPELLDYLASRFMDNGWSIKAMHREIMLSATYQQASAFDAAAYQVDGDNKLLWHMNRRRLEVESWRDSMLAVAGNLDRTPFGPGTDLSSADHRRRTLYASVSRHNLDPLLRLFDFPDPNLTSDRRTITTVPLQQLFVLNSEFMVKQAKSLTARITAEDTDEPTRIRKAFAILYGRPPSDSEIQLGVEFLTGPADSPGKAKTLTRWERYAQVLLGANEFLFVD
jgi:mono/diheme cytochrome c family protein